MLMTSKFRFFQTWFSPTWNFRWCKLLPDFDVNLHLILPPTKAIMIIDIRFCWNSIQEIFSIFLCQASRSCQGTGAFDYTSTNECNPYSKIFTIFRYVIHCKNIKKHFFSNLIYRFFEIWVFKLLVITKWRRVLQKTNAVSFDPLILEM